MHHHIFRALLFVLPLTASAMDYVVPPGDVGTFFAGLPKDVTRIVFSAANKYHSEGDIVLPDVPMLTVDGNGCKLTLGQGSNGFMRTIADQKDALQRITCRYFIHNFAAIEGGRRAVYLPATYGSSITDLQAVGQSEAAIDLRFCLMCRVQNVLVTHPRARGIVVRDGDWPGATATNSQSNSTVLEQCRIYCGKTCTDAFAVINSGGVRMQDCISEGSSADRDLFLSATMDGNEARSAGNPVVKSFTLDNFHIEHAVRKQCIYVNMPSKAAVRLSNVYINHPQEQPAIYHVNGQLDLADIGWWTPRLRIATRMHAPRINVERCHSDLSIGKAKETKPGPQAGVFVLMDADSSVKTIDPRYIRIMAPSF